MHCTVCGYAVPEGAARCPICGRPCTTPAPQGGRSSKAAAFFDAILPAPEEMASTPPEPPEPPVSRSSDIRQSRRLWIGLLAVGVMLAVLAVLLILRPWRMEPPPRSLTEWTTPERRLTGRESMPM